MVRYKYTVVWVPYNKYELTGMPPYKALEYRLNKLVENGGRVIAINQAHHHLAGGSRTLDGWDVTIEREVEE